MGELDEVDMHCIDSNRDNVLQIPNLKVRREFGETKVIGKLVHIVVLCSE